MVEVKAKVGILSGDQIEKIHQYSLEILSRVGVRVDSKNARKPISSRSNRLMRVSVTDTA